ncbi:M56 family metallopeptidase [Sphingosinicella sp. CPCC 101087]|uniref:M56 family metallopeptidase n=1 Tax=Sphingosinicella sp. CPCC 101087 TaxID=2497754 RepID=UPI00101BA8B9|nr:M56 family metallopeptidase [Sphingosinicella sp. CPCC 101087]
MTVDFFIEMAWKSALISAAALALAALLRSRAAADRVLVLQAGVVALLLLPLVSLWLPALRIEIWAAPAASAVPAVVAAPESGPVLPLTAAMQPAGTSIWDDPTPLLLIAYLAGLLMVGSRLIAGLATLRRWTAAAREVTCPEWRAALDRARWAAPDAERLRLLVSDELPSPLSWGWRRPVILIDRETLDRPEDAEAILAHEVAHVARRDWPALLLSRLVSAVFWFNPLVRWLEREVEQQTEEAADSHAIGALEPSLYARTLLNCAPVAGALPANSIASSAGALARRIRAVLDAGRRERPRGSAWTAAAMVACVGLAAPVAAVELVEAAPVPPPSAPAAPAAPPAPAAPISHAAPPAPSAPPAPVAAITVVGQAAPKAPLAPPSPGSPAPLAPAAPPAPPAAFAPAAPGTPRPPVPPRALVPVETLVAMRIHGVDPGYVGELAALGPAYARLAADDLVAMRVHDVTPAFVRDMIRAGYPNLTPDQLMAMRIHGVDARGARRAASREGRLPSVDRLVAMAIRGEI